MGKKNLDDIFQEKLTDFSEVPDGAVWESIEASLDKKKKSRKVIPLWWKWGGIAALLVIGVFLWNSLENTATTSPIVTDVDNATKNPSEKNSTSPVFGTQNSNKEQLVGAPQKDSLDKVNEIPDEQVVRMQDAPTENLSSTSKKNTSAITIAATETQKTGEQKATETSENDFNTANKETVVVASELESNTPDGIKTNTKETPLSTDIERSTKEVVAQNENANRNIEIEEESKKKSIFDEIAEQEQEEIVQENSRNKWSAGPSVAPVFFSAIGEGSPVHSIFVPNSKSGDVNLSYGLSVAYEVSKKLSIRSGIHKVDYGYRTNDVVFSSSLENATSNLIDNINYTATSRTLVVNSKVNTTSVALNQNPFLNTSSEDVSAVSAVRDGALEQQFGYLEVPLELNYALVDKKFGVNLIGGISSLFLVDNSISLSSGELIAEVGEANNINSVNISTNVGFGMNYKFSPKIQLNIEPVFKYQLNTFSETDGTFNPFSIGIYSGFNFKF